MDESTVTIKESDELIITDTKLWFNYDEWVKLVEFNKQKELEVLPEWIIPFVTKPKKE